MAEDVSLEFIGRSLQALNEQMRALRDLPDEVRDMRRDIRDVRSVVLSLVDSQRRLRDDLELMIRSESMGRAAHFETIFEHRLGDLRERVDALGPAKN